jgi:DNA recombination protein RmuC
MPMLDFILSVLTASVLGFSLGWLIRTFRLRATEAAADGQIQGLRLQLEQMTKEFYELKTAHTDLRHQHFDESTARASAEAVARQLPGLVSKLEDCNEEISAYKTRVATLELELANERASLKNERELLQQARATLSDSFKALSADALKSNNQAFIDLAKSTLETFQEGARAELAARQTAVDQMVQPIKESLSKVDNKLGEIESQRVAAYASLNEQLKGLVETHLPVLRNETANLVKALRQPSVRGRYGEVQLKRVVEMAGMLDHCDFVEQEHRRTDEGSLRPDLIVKLPGGRNIVVDAKTPISAYLEALEATDESTQRILTAQHAQQCRNHINALGRKAYWEQFTPTPEFVVMFIPGEVFFSAALQEDPTLLEAGVNEKVILATPTTLIALLRAVHYGWRQEKLAQNAEEVAKLGKELYDRIRTLSGHWSELGDRLGRAVEAYNRSTSTLESRVLVSTRRFKDLNVACDSELLPLKQIEVIPRIVQVDELAPTALSVTNGRSHNGNAAA